MVLVVAFTVPMSNGLLTTATHAWRALVLGCVAAFIVTHRWLLDRRMWIWHVAVGLAVVAVVSGWFEAARPGAHSRAGALIVLQWLLLPPVCLWIASRPVHARWMSVGFLAGQTLSACVALAAAVLDTMSIGRSTAAGRLQGLAGHPNVLGLLSAVACVMVVDAVVRRRASTTLIVVGLVNLVAILSSGSVSALGALCVGAIGLVLGGERVSRTVLRSLAAALACAVVYSVVASSSGLATPLARIRETSGQTEAISTLDERTETWKFAMAQIESRPLHGVGLDDESGQTPVRGIVVHNVVLRSWYQGGAALGAAIILLLSAIVLRAVRSIRHRRAVAPAAVLLTVVSFSMTSAALQQSYYWMVVIAAWSMVLVASPRPVPLAVARGAAERVGRASGVRSGSP